MTTRRLPLLIALSGFLLPPLIAIPVVWVLTREDYFPTVILLALSISGGIPFLFLAAIARGEIQTYAGGPSAGRSLFRVIATWLVMLVIAVAVAVEVERSLFLDVPGSSTSAIAVVTAPFFYLFVGLATYCVVAVMAWLAARMGRVGAAKVEE